MKLLTTLSLFLTLASSLLGANYYVSTTGSDSNAGSLSAPFKTIQKAADIMASGDKCYLREGSYREKVTIKTNNTSFEAYNNEFVVITGADLVTGWSQHDGNIYKASFAGVEPQFTQVFYNGDYQKIARYPDLVNEDRLVITDGYADCNVYQNGAVTFDNTLPGETDHWEGGYFRAISGLTWMNPMGKITASSGKNLTCDMISNTWIEGNDKSIGNGVGYILHLNALSMAGEWYHEDNTLYFWKPGGGQPSNTEVEAQKRELALVLDNRSNITLKNIHIKAASVKINNANNCQFEGCSFRYQKGFYTRNQYHWSYTAHGGVYVNGDYNTFDGCYFQGTWGNLLNIENGDGNTVTSCIFEDNGYISQFTSCIQNGSENLTVEWSTFGETGRFHIRCDKGNHSNKIDILHNDFYDCMKMGQDAGSIEITNGGNDDITYDIGGSEIAYNKFHDISTLSSFISTKNYVLALYLEGCDNYTVHHNLTYNVRTEHEQGAFLYLGPRQCTISECYYYNNTSWDVDKMIGVWNKDGNGGITDMEFINNIFYSDAVVNFGTPSLEGGVTMSHNLSTTNAGTFVDAANGDFTLANGSAAIDYGQTITGITDGYQGSSPDAGCFEKGVTPWTCGASILRSSFEKDGIDPSLPTVESATFTSTITEVEQGNEFTVEVSYAATQTRDLVVTFNSADNTWLGTGKVKVNAGSGTLNVTVPLNTTPELGSGYKLKVALRPEDGNWETDIKAELQIVEVVEAAPAIPTSDYVELINLPESFVQGNSISVRVAYTATEQRDISLIFSSPSGAYIANKRQTVEAGSGELDMTINLNQVPDIANDYKLDATMRTVGGSYADNTFNQMYYIDIVDEIITALLNTKAKASAYPNPFNHKVSIDLKGMDAHQALLYNACGQIILSKDINNTSFDLILNSTHPDGIYYLHLVGNNISKTLKLIKD